MIIYRGLGFLALITFICALFGLALTFDAVLGTNSLSRRPLWPLLVSNVAAAALTWALGRFLNREPPAATVYEAAGPRTLLEPKHTLYFVRMEYWGPIFSALVLALVLTR